MRFEGVFVANVTPFDSKGNVLTEGLENHLSFLADRGVQGFVPCGTTGEAATLNLEEWRNVIATTKKFAAARGLKTIAGCGGNCTWMVLERLREAKELGCDAALVVTPYYNKPTSAGVIAHYEHLADQGTLPIILYNVPSRTNVSLSADTVARLFAHPNIVGLKEASGQYSHWLDLASRLDLSTKALLAGDDDAFVTMRALGGSGIISASANLVPEHFVRLHAFTSAGQWQEAFHLQKRLHPLIRSMFAETNPAPVKYALSRLGLVDDRLRLPLVPVGTETRALVDRSLRELELLT